GKDAYWGNSGELQLGVQANAELTIEAGGIVESTTGSVGGGDRPGVTGTVLVTGANSVWANVSGMAVGAENTGYLTVGGGGRVTSRHGAIGLGVDAVGVLTVSGTDEYGNASICALEDERIVGTQGTGALNVADSGMVRVGNGAGAAAIATAE